MGTQKTRVIVVEDHAVMRETLKQMVEQVDHCVVVAEAGSGIEALDVIANVPADLILLDLSLPRLSGMDVLEQTRPLTGAKMLVVTMFQEDHVIRKAMDLGADCWFVKDQGMVAFKKVVAEVLEGECTVLTP